MCTTKYISCTMSDVLGSKYGKRPLRALLSTKKLKKASNNAAECVHEIDISMLDESNSLLAKSDEIHNFSENEAIGAPRLAREARFKFNGRLSDVWRHMTTFMVVIRRNTWSGAFYNASRNRRGGFDRVVSFIAHLVLFIVAMDTLNDNKNFETNYDLHYSAWPKDTCPGDYCKLTPVHTSERKFGLLALVAAWGFTYASLHVLVEILAVFGWAGMEIMDRWLDIVHVGMLNFFINSINGQTDILTHTLMFLFNIMLFLYIENLAHNPGGCYWKNVVGCESARNIELPFVTLVVGVSWFVALFPTVHENSDIENEVPVLWSLVPFALLLIWITEVVYMYRAVNASLSKMMYGPQSTTFRLFSAWAKHTVYIFVAICVIRFTCKDA